MRPSAASCLARLSHPQHAFGVQPVHRLVEDQRCGIAEQRRGEAEPLTHAEGEPADPLPGGADSSPVIANDFVDRLRADAVSGRGQRGRCCGAAGRVDALASRRAPT